MKRNSIILLIVTVFLLVTTTILAIVTLTGKEETEPSETTTTSLSSVATSSATSLAADTETSPATDQETTTSTTEESSSAPESSASSETSETEEGVEILEGTFLGVKDYGAPQTKKENAADFQFRFLVQGSEQLYAIDNSLLDENGKPAYPVQNKLKEGYSFKIYIKDSLITDVTEMPHPQQVSYTPVVSGTPGERTLINFIKTSLMPVGTTLYVFGGGWDWQDTGSAIQARTLGVSSDWVRFFNQQDENYTFRDKNGDESLRDPKTSYYPFGGYNEYYYAGLDCSGFVGWTVYNTFETENGRPGYVGYAVKMAKRFSDEYGWGSFSSTISPSDSGKPLLPGDVISIKGHVWISLGTCEDGSVLMVHSTNGFISRAGQPGGGVALGAIGNSKECEAYRLADSYMSRFYPEWYSRYEVNLTRPSNFFKSEGETTGRFSWDTTSGQGLTDELGAQNMSPEQILKYCFGEK